MKAKQIRLNRKGFSNSCKALYQLADDLIIASQNLLLSYDADTVATTQAHNVYAAGCSIKEITLILRRRAQDV